MTHLPVVHMTLYKHGVGYFRRRGAVEGQALKLTFRREEMDDLLKSLTVIDHAGGQIQGIDYDTPQSLKERLAGCSIILDDKRSLRDMLAALRGRVVRLQVSDGSNVEGTFLGLDEAGDKPLEQSLVSVLQTDSENVAVLSLNRIQGVELLDETSATDLRFFLQTALGQETHRSISIRLSPGSHDLEVSYIAPAPTWRVSYRLVMDISENKDTEALLQGWGIFDNRLEEDLSDISLSLTAGMPISFMYNLYTPHTPKRPVIEEEDRVAAGPIDFESASEDADMYLAKSELASERAFMEAPRASLASMAESVESVAAGKELGELFQYEVKVPVTVGRGQSAMVPIVSSKLKPKKDLIYNGSKMDACPVATLRFENSTGLTLERGPVTVLENGEYVGESVLSFTADKAEAIISYAVELGVHIKEDVKESTELDALEINDGYLVRHVYDVRRTEYQVDNRTSKAKTVLIERRTTHYSTFDTPDPVERTLDWHRYQVDAQPGKITTLTVNERHLLAYQEELWDQTYQGLKEYLDDKFLDKQLYKSLKALLDVWAEISDLEKVIEKQDKRSKKIYKTQGQIQKNMGALTQEGEEGQLRGRYVTQLTQTEEELANIDQIVTRTRTKIEKKQAEIERLIALLG